MKHRLAKTVVLWSAIGAVSVFVVLFVLCFLLSAYSALEAPLGYARLWLAPGHDVARHVNFVLSAEEGRGRQVADKVSLLEVLELDARWGNRLRYDRTVLIKYAGSDMARTMDPMAYEEPMQAMAGSIIVRGPDGELVKAAFDHYRADADSTYGLCERYAVLKALGEFHNPAAVPYCRDTPDRNDIRKPLFG